MFDFHEKRKLRSVLFSWPTIALLFVASFFLAGSVYERYVKERETAVKRAERAIALADYRERAVALESKVAYMESERGIEEEIRNRYDATKEGERVAVIMGDSVASKAIPEQDVGEESSNTILRLLLSVFLFWR